MSTIGIVTLHKQHNTDTQENGMVPAKTMVTFDKGAQWQKLKPPKRDHKGEPIECEGCSLHLNGKTSGFLGPVYR
jgi:hypothetical protein